jgi:hypothetical protein
LPRIGEPYGKVDWAFSGVDAFLGPPLNSADFLRQLSVGTERFLKPVRIYPVLLAFAGVLMLASAAFGLERRAFLTQPGTEKSWLNTSGLPSASAYSAVLLGAESSAYVENLLSHADT